MSGVAREAGAARQRLSAVSGAGHVDRLSLITLGRRHLVRARHTQHGCSAVELFAEPGVTGLWLVALAARSRPSTLPLDDLATIQVMQGRIRVYRDSMRPALLPGDVVLGPVPVDELIALTDVVLVVTGRPVTCATVTA